MKPKRVGLWANSPQRVATYVPLARATVKVGHACRLMLDPKMELDDDDQAMLAGVDIQRVQAGDLPELGDIDVFVSSEAMWRHVPEAGVKVAVMHSLPDRDILKTNYSKWLAGRETLVANFDYMVAHVVQKDTHWSVDAYKPYVDTARTIEGRAKLPNFSVIPGGYPKTDYLDARLARAKAPDTIIYCPTISVNRESSVQTHGPDILKTLHGNFPGYRIVFRPYPTDEESVIADVLDRAGPLDSLVIDRSLTGVADQLRCAFAVTDKSSSAITFSICSGRPSIFFEPDNGVSGGVENEIGYLVRGFDWFMTGARRCISDAALWREKIRKVRAARLYHPFDSSAYFASQINTIAAGGAAETWLSIPRL